MRAFDYDLAFSRNIGWLRQQEQQALHHKRVAIAGMGGVGGVHLLTLVRLGIGSFCLADFDDFDIQNFNRQVGASMSSVGRNKCTVLADMARAIHPDIDLRLFEEGVTSENIDKFLEGVDLYVDGLDFFAFGARKLLFKACREKNIPAITAAPLGMGVALLNFLPGKMSFETYFDWDQDNEEGMALKFLLGLAPARLHFGYLVDETAVSLAEKRGPSTMMACQLCAGVVGTEALKILLGRGPVMAAPWSLQFDAYRYKMVKVWRPWGNRHPLQRLVLRLAHRRLAGLEKGTLL